MKPTCAVSLCSSMLPASVVADEPFVYDSPETELKWELQGDPLRICLSCDPHKWCWSICTVSILMNAGTTSLTQLIYDTVLHWSVWKFGMTAWWKDRKRHTQLRKLSIYAAYCFLLLIVADLIYDETWCWSLLSHLQIAILYIIGYALSPWSCVF